MEVEEETTSNHLEDLIPSETTTVNNERLLENTTSIDKQSENELSNLVTKSNSQEEEDLSVLLPKSEDSEAVLEKVEEVVVHCQDSESVAALSGGFENSVAVESMNVVQDSKDGDDAAVKEIDVPSDDVAAVECGGSELTSSVKADGGEGEEAVVERKDYPELVAEKVENDGDDSNVGESSAIEKDDNEGNEMVEPELKPEDEKETVKEEEAADVLKVGDEGVVLSSPVVYNDGGDEMTDQSKNDGDLNVRSEDVDNVQGIVGSDVRDDGDADVQVENIDNLQGDEAMAEIVKAEDIVPEEPVVADIAKEEDIVPEEPVDSEIVKEEDIAPEEPVAAEIVQEEDIIPEEPVDAEIAKEEDIVPEEPVVAEIGKEQDTVPDEDPSVGDKADLKEESLMANEETVDGVAENEEETMVEEEDKSLDTEMETDEKSLDTDIDTEKSLDIEMETEKSIDAEVETEEEANLADEEKVQEEEEVETEPELPESSKKGSAGKRKRGGKVSKTSSKKTMEEDVCFICFDGGDLVLCDRRNCPKAYHPSCVNRDEAFFQSKGSWNCGWHLCSICEKKAEYMCYTCTYSSCRSCIKTSVLLSIRDKEKKGLCEACMRTVMLIEKPENQENANFEDENSWEHLFKDYWTETKERYNLSLEELSQAKKHSDIKDDTNLGSDTPPENPRTRKSKRQTKKQKYDAISDSPTNWVSKDLLEFITHMKNGDSSVISQYEIQDLLLEYIKRNKLRDPNKKSQIICDARLENLFGKPRVAHIEMLKLLESHFLGKEDSLVDDVQGSVVDDGESYEKEVKDKKRKGKKKGEKRGPQLNREDYAAIDIHNISLIYMRRKLVEDLLDDMEVFRDKIVGTFVRIRISGANQKQDIYRLVQVTGTSEAGQYTLGKRTTSTMLEILNLDKTEIIPIDTISNQEFTEEECKRLRQSIKCGLINRLTVGDILDKAMELQEARVNDWLETETVRLNHLRDRASDMGRFKELKECVEKLRLLKEPEERARRLEEFPLVHDDPTMDPEYESEEDTNSDDRRRELYKRSDSFRFNKRGRDQFSPRGRDNFSPRGKDQFSPRGDYTSNSKEAWSRQSSGKNYEYTRNLSNKNLQIKPDDATSSFEMHTESPRDSKRAPFVQQPIKSEKPSSIPNIQPPPVTESTPKVNDSDKIWHYKDPSGKIQGPFSMGQLRKWSKNGYFPAHLEIWKKSEKEDDGILLNDALEGNFQNVVNKLPSPTPTKSSTGWPVGQSPNPNPNPNPSLIPCVNKDANVAGTSVVSVSNVPVNTVQGGQVVPQMVQAVSGQDPHGWNGGAPQVNPAVNMQPMVYNQWPGGPTMVQDASGNFVQQPMAGGPQQFPFVNQNIPQQQQQVVQQPNVNWGTMGMNPNMVQYPGMTWPMVQGPQVTATMDPNWVGSVAGWVQQPPVPGVVPNQTYPGGWVGPVAAGWGAPVQGNVNAGWNQGAPGTTNMGWVAPPGTQTQLVATPTPTPTLPTPIPAPIPIPIPIPTATPTQTGNSSNQGNWGGQNQQQQGNWGGNEQQQNRGGYSGQRRSRGSGFQGNNNNNNSNNNNNRRQPYNKQDSFNNNEGGRSGDSSAR